MIRIYVLRARQGTLKLRFPKVFGKNIIPSPPEFYNMIEAQHEKTESNTCPPEACDTFQFMAKEIGLSVLHPGGLRETRKLAQLCKVNRNQKILDLGCGKGSTSILLAKTIGCHVVGVDIDEELLTDARMTAKQRNLNEITEFRYADIENLPFEDNTFDGAIAQAVLVFTNKEKTLREVSRVVKPGGFFGAIELSWKQAPTEYIAKRVKQTLCSVSVEAELHQSWIDHLQKAGLRVVHDELKDLRFAMQDMLQDEGLLRGLGVLRGYLKPAARERLSSFSCLFEETDKYLGYGVYVGRVI
jgi:ubiquinone/menaquinone biosynthesis C-methylase UbiE